MVLPSFIVDFFHFELQIHELDKWHMHQRAAGVSLYGLDKSNLFCIKLLQFNMGKE
jgi:hypothetical protein